MPHMAQRVAGLGTTIFSEINTLARQHGAVNLGQGAPDFDGPPEVLAAAVEAVNGGFNQYAPGIGIPKTREAIAAHALRFYGQQLDPTTQVLVTSGATEAMFAAVLGLCDKGDEVIVFEPVYDSYIPNLHWAGLVPLYVQLRPPTWAFDPDELRAAFARRPRAILINTPHNPTGKVFTREELQFIADLCQQYDVVAITDEVYEHILYDGATHIRLGTLPGMADRALSISSLGKSFSVTGWKIGWVVGSPELVMGVNRAHQFITFAVSSPLQAAAAHALTLPDAYFTTLRTTYQARRDYMIGALREAGLEVYTPQGSYFIMVNWRGVAPAQVQDDVQFARWLISEVGVACIPPSAFYRESEQHQARHMARFAVCKKDETLQAAVTRLSQIANR